jgi:hypothetical protein
MNSYDLTSHTSLEAALSQYYIDSEASVRLTLHGPRSYCDLKAIQDPKIKEILVNVGIEFERAQGNRFFNFTHTFRPIETRENNRENDNLVKDTFAFINAAINDQTNGKLTLNLTDITKLIVKKAEDRSFIVPRRAYELEIEVSEKAVTTAEKSGLVFREYVSSLPKSTTAYVLGIGEKQEE